MKNESIKEIIKGTTTEPAVANASLVKQIYGKNKDFETTRNLVEDKFGVTIKSGTDIGRITTLDFLEGNVKDKSEVMKLGVSVKAITKTSAKKLDVANLF